MAPNPQQPQNNNNQQQPSPPRRKMQLAEVKTILLKLRETREGTVFDAYDALIVEMYGRLSTAERQVSELIKAVRILADAGEEEGEEPAEEKRDVKSQPFPEGFSASPNGDAPPPAATADEGVEEGEGEIPEPSQNASRVTNVSPIPGKG